MLQRIEAVLDWITDSLSHLFIGLAGLYIGGTVILGTYAGLTTWLAGTNFWLTFGVGMTAMVVCSMPGLAIVAMSILDRRR